MPSAIVQSMHIEAKVTSEEYAHICTHVRTQREYNGIWQLAMLDAGPDLGDLGLGNCIREDSSLAVSAFSSIPLLPIDIIQDSKGPKGCQDNATVDNDES
ncbi:hypothetical protein KQX54_019768 [Cotesia glomerata]|uniref:Uncharacterized protein n=1 Tax=Cotesia glomerata TaxID=32391 RepID=A0AAV7J1Z6_COTGL|nr:hypothetical protein KQX54_019768 [Cotesia glomerata]